MGYRQLVSQAEVREYLPDDGGLGDGCDVPDPGKELRQGSAVGDTNTATTGSCFGTSSLRRREPDARTP